MNATDQGCADILATLQGCGEFYHEPTDQHLFIAVVKGERKIIGRVAHKLHGQSPIAAKLISSRIWAEYFKSELPL